MKGGRYYANREKGTLCCRRLHHFGCCAQVVYQLIEAGKLQAYKEDGRKMLENTS